MPAHQGIVDALIVIVTHVVTAWGYLGVFLWMALSAIVPVPSEVILAFAGRDIAVNHQFNLHAIAFMGSLGNLAGSIVAYGIGAYGGRPFVEKYGKYLLIRHHDIALADEWFQHHGDAIVFWTRMMPLIRAFVSLPAGIARMNFGKFCLYTFVGALPWCYLLTWAGVKLGQHWNVIEHYLHAADAAILVCIVVLLGLYIYRHLKPEAPTAAV